MTGQVEGVGGPTGTLILGRGDKEKNRDTESGCSNCSKELKSEGVGHALQIWEDLLRAPNHGEGSSWVGWEVVSVKACPEVGMWLEGGW